MESRKFQESKLTNTSLPTTKNTMLTAHNIQLMFKDLEKYMKFPMQHTNLLFTYGMPYE